MWGANEWNDWFCSSTAWYACEKRESTLENEAAQLKLENEMNASAVDDIQRTENAERSAFDDAASAVTSEEKATAEAAL